MKEEKYTVGDIVLYGCVVCDIMFVLPFYFIKEPKHWSLVSLKICAMVPLTCMFLVACQATWDALISALDDSAEDEIAEETNCDSDNMVLLLSLIAFLVFALGLFASSAWMWTDDVFLVFAGNVAVSMSWILLLVLSVFGP